MAGGEWVLLIFMLLPLTLSWGWMLDALEDERYWTPLRLHTKWLEERMKEKKADFLERSKRWSEEFEELAGHHWDRPRMRETPREPGYSLPVLQEPTTFQQIMVEVDAIRAENKRLTSMIGYWANHEPHDSVTIMSYGGVVGQYPTAPRGDYMAEDY